MIIGIGTDFIDLKRIKGLFDKYQNNFAKKILSKSEMTLFKNKTYHQKISFLASSFSAKESFVKALGTGFSGIYPKDISLHKDKKGKPFLKSEVLKVRQLFHHLSITNTKKYTLSVVVLEK
jgi:holo-[acyl-carrier protein] synthase